MQNTVETRVRNLMAAHFSYEGDVNAVELTQPLKELGLSSLTFVKFLVGLEKEFDIEVEDENLNLNKFKTLHDLILYVESKVSDQAAV